MNGNGFPEIPVLQNRSVNAAALPDKLMRKSTLGEGFTDRTLVRYKKLVSVAALPEVL
jgi:hypothetical protein